jgi:hypothetical protein
MYISPQFIQRSFTTVSGTTTCVSEECLRIEVCVSMTFYLSFPLREESLFLLFRIRTLAAKMRFYWQSCAFSLRAQSKLFVGVCQYRKFSEDGKLCYKSTGT